MATKPNQLLCTALLLASLILTNFPARTLSDAGDCPYPCYPPPTGPGGTTPSTGPPPPPPQSASNTNPPPLGYYNPPTGYMPYTPPPPYGGSDGGDGGDYGTLSPPDPIMPYFPYYYRKPPHQPADGSSAATSRVMITMTTLVSFLVSFSYL